MSWLSNQAAYRAHHSLLNNHNFLEVNELTSTPLPENEGLDAWLRKKKKMIVDFQYMPLGRTLSVQAHNHFLSGYLKQLIVKCIGRSCSCRLPSWSAKNKEGMVTLYHRRKSPMVQHKRRPQKCACLFEAWRYFMDYCKVWSGLSNRLNKGEIRIQEWHFLKAMLQQIRDIFQNFSWGKSHK